MSSQRDPVDRAAEDGADLYDVSTWEPRSIVDRLSWWLYTGLAYGFRAVVLFVAVAITLSLLASPALLVAEEPFLGAFFGLSVVPALALAAYIWYADVTTNEPLALLVATFVLAILFATFAALVNNVGMAVIQPFSFVGMLAFFYLVVGPVEEGVKLLAVRVFAYRSDSFDAVIDGAVYGAVAGLGFAAIENALYITTEVAQTASAGGIFTVATGIASLRALVGPGHVIYSAIAGYYLGLAKFNPTNAGPLVVKGLLVAAVFHATYNSTVQVVPVLANDLWGVDTDVAFVTYVIVYDTAIGYYLYRKLSRYRRTYRAVDAGGTAEVPPPERTEFDPSRR